MLHALLAGKGNQVECPLAQLVATVVAEALCLGGAIMDKEYYTLAGFALALIVSLTIGQFFSGVVIGLAVGYSICDKGAMVSSVWAKLHPHIKPALAGAKLIAGVK
jgi:hypothetical protein